jgi:DNA-binding transcriptional LysR family regulator
MATWATILYVFTMPERKRTVTLDWDDIRYFVALARHGSLSATSRALRVNHATVSRRVASLETKLGRDLFDRRADGYALTAEGTAVLDEAQAMDEGALSILRRLDTGTELSGLVRLTAARVLAEGFLIDRLGALRERYPALDIEVLTEARVVSLARRQADIALRLGSPKDSDLIGRRAAKIAFGLYASPGYRDNLKAGQPPDIIGFDEDSDFIFEAGWLTRQFPRARFAFRSNSQASQAAAARAGYGVALLPRYLAAKDSGLVKVLSHQRLPQREVWLLVRRDLARVPRIRAVADYLFVMFQRERRLLGDR